MNQIQKYFPLDKQINLIMYFYYFILEIRENVEKFSVRLRI